MNISPTFETPYRGPHATHGPPVGHPCCKEWLTTIWFQFWPEQQSGKKKHRQFLDSFSYVVSDVIQQKAGLRCPWLYGQTCDSLFLSFYSKHKPRNDENKKKIVQVCVESGRFYGSSLTSVVQDSTTRTQL